MNRQMRRLSERYGRRAQRKPWDSFQDVTIEAMERHRILNPGSSHRPDKVWQNSQYIVQVFRGKKVLGRPATKIMIRRSDSEPVHSWQDLFRIKNEIFGPEIEAIEVYPKVSELTDVANLYWLWIFE